MITRFSFILVLSLLVLGPAVSLRAQDPETQDPEEGGTRVTTWDVISENKERWKQELAEHGLSINFDAVLLGQWADTTISGKDELVTGLFHLDGEFEVFESDDAGQGSINWTVFGGNGINYSLKSENMAQNTGAFSMFSNYTAPADTILVNELFWKQTFEEGEFELILGHVDMSNHFDLNRAANNAYRQFLSGSLTNNYALPFPAYGGFGAVVRAQMNQHVSLSLGVGDSSPTKPTAPWSTAGNDSWMQLLEIGIKTEIDELGENNLRLTPWHNDLSDEEGWGFGVNIDQDLGSDQVIAFFRFGVGDEDVIAAENFVGGGIEFRDLFDREGDSWGIGVTWADPSPGVGTRSETIFETYYRFMVTPSLHLSPDLMLIHHPAQQSEDQVFVASVRMGLLF
ncbi:MAG: carbohydrate porin [Planctomycetota bacterium]|jgi:carbohydrate-selective porin OprB